MNRKDVVDTSEPFTRQKFMCKSWLQNEMIDCLTLNMNRIRQASITREIIEIVSGAAALG